MVKLGLSVVLLISLFTSGVYAHKDQGKPDLKPLIAAIIMVESTNNDYAIGDKDLRYKAYGPMQIRQPAVTDVNERNGTNYCSQDCFGNRQLSIWIFERYMARYATKKRLGRAPTDEDRARIWNGGPNGYKDPDTLDYWAKVKRELKK